MPHHRPFELIVHDVRRLHRRYCETRTGVSFAKSEAVRRAYDDALAEGCDALGLSHLLGVLEAGEELDRERTRVERLLHRWGLALDAQVGSALLAGMSLLFKHGGHP